MLSITSCDLFYNWQFVPLNLLHLFAHSHAPFLSRNHKFVLCIWESVSLLLHVSLLLQIPHISDPWKRKWQPTPVFLSGEFHGQRSLEGYSLQGHEESTQLKRLRMHALISENIQYLVLSDSTYFTKHNTLWVHSCCCK